MASDWSVFCRKEPIRLSVTNQYSATFTMDEISKLVFEGKFELFKIKLQGDRNRATKLDEVIVPIFIFR